MFDKLWDFVVDSVLIPIFMPLISLYFAFTANFFFNVSIPNATGLEYAANLLLTPVQFVFAGKEAVLKEDGHWDFVQRFDYSEHFWLKESSCLVALAPSVVIGSACKLASLLSNTSRDRYATVSNGFFSTTSSSNRPLYQQMGIDLTIAETPLVSENYERRPGDESYLDSGKEALQDITRLLNNAQIPWWLDCGSCLGAYRYGGIIPWDFDIDIAILQPDFENVRRALNGLDSNLYVVQDWSSRDHPNSYLKVYIRKTKTMIDIYNFQIDAEKKQVSYILALENHLFFPAWWKAREKPYKIPTEFSTVFPLRKANFDGIEVFVPNDTKKYLQRYYGENLSPAKIYDSATGCYEKDLSHPYWKEKCAH